MRDPSSLGHYSVASVEDIRMLDPVAVGDRVSFITSGPDSGHITGVLPRTSKLTRRAAENEHLEQVIVANADQVITVIAAANPKPKWNLLDRYLASAEASELPAIIAITKVDLVEGTKAEREVLAYAEEYASIGYRVGERRGHRRPARRAARQDVNTDRQVRRRQDQSAQRAATRAGSARK
jgi:putative ribosome biogenesis GTPase RsgA